MNIICPSLMSSLIPYNPPPVRQGMKEVHPTNRKPTPMPEVPLKPLSRRNMRLPRAMMRSPYTPCSIYIRETIRTSAPLTHECKTTLHPCAGPKPHPAQRVKGLGSLKRIQYNPYINPMVSIFFSIIPI